MMDKARLEQLVILKITKKATKCELEELSLLAQLYPDIQDYVEAIEGLQVRKQVVSSSERMQRQFDTLWERAREEESARAIKERDSPQFTFKITSWRKIAAAIVLFLGISFAAYQFYNRQTDSDLISLSAPLGETRAFTLPDGSKVKLNAGSTLEYARNFNQGSTRELRLNGEAFFDVQQNSRQAFRLITRHLHVNVLGTSFTVKAYENDHDIETTLLTGKIRVEMNENGEVVELKPYQKIIFSPQQKGSYQLVDVKKENQAVPMMKETAWLSNVLVFEDESLNEIAKRMERRYDVQVIFRDAQLGEQKISGFFKEESLKEALFILKQTTPMDYQIKGKIVYLSSTKSN